MIPDGQWEAPGKIVPAFSLSASLKSSPLQQSHKCDVVPESEDGGGTRGVLLLPKSLCVQHWELLGTIGSSSAPPSAGTRGKQCHGDRARVP